MIKADLIRAARGLLAWSWEDLAQKSGVSRPTLMNIGKEKSTPKAKTMDKIIKAFENAGVEFTERGVQWADKRIEIIEGEDCYERLLDKATIELVKAENKELLIMFASDAVSPPEVNERYRSIRSKNIQMRQLIKEGDTYIMGELKEYRTIPEDHFTNVVTLIYSDYVAQVDGSGKTVTIHHDSKLAKRERDVFDLLWNIGEQPEISTAEETF